MSDIESPPRTGCLAPIDKDGLQQLIEKGKANPGAVRTLKCRTVTEGRFRQLNFVRNLPRACDRRAAGPARRRYCAPTRRRRCSRRWGLASRSAFTPTQWRKT